MNNRWSCLPEALETRSMLAYGELISSFGRSQYSSLFLEKLRALNIGALYQSKLHGRDHIERVMLLASLLAYHLLLDREDTDLLLDACSYHDVGRINDKLDDDHGRRSGKKIQQITGRPEGEDVRILRAMVEAHSIHDKAMDGTIRKHNVLDFPRAKQLSLVLKDADGLDRVRLQGPFLDPRYLRFGYSKTLIPFSKQVYAEERRLSSLQATQ
ncbi:MAG: HD domain-containing protein [Oscillospiraceae bacterium]|nr:HD domain-containing protein [Oscillospiraceae bacterium]